MHNERYLRRRAMTTHAARRCRQRGITLRTVDAVIRFGRRTYQNDGSCRYVLTRRQLRGLRPRLDPALWRFLEGKSRPLFVLCDARSGVVITTGHQIQRVKEGSGV